QGLPAAFAAETAALVREAENAARLAPALQMLADDYERRASSRLGLGAALTYPLALAFVVMVLILLLLIFVIPAFKHVYASFGADLPGPTLLLLSLADALSDYGWLWFPALVAAVVLIVLR